MSAFGFLIDPMSGRQFADAPSRTISGSSCGVRHTAETLAAAREVQRQFELVRERDEARLAALRAKGSTCLSCGATFADHAVYLGHKCGGTLFKVSPRGRGES